MLKKLLLVVGFIGSFAIPTLILVPGLIIFPPIFFSLFSDQPNDAWMLLPVIAGGFLGLVGAVRLLTCVLRQSPTSGQWPFAFIIAGVISLSLVTISVTISIAEVDSITLYLSLPLLYMAFLMPEYRKIQKRAD